MYVCIHVEEVENLEKYFKLFVINGGSGIEEEESHCLDYDCWKISYVTQKKPQNFLYM